MFTKILIANRGEIACRVIKTARKMGIETVAVYSAADREALHVSRADEAVFIGPPPSAQSYLMMENIIQACKDTGAQAVHPGYGFLSENKNFQERLATEGIAFIGPDSYAIEAMGDKITSKKLAAQAAVSTVPGYMGLIEDSAQAVTIAKEIGFPVMIKATAGGGGKGMRVAWREEDVRDDFERASSEARSSFGDDRMFIEKFVEQPHHIEIQILSDGETCLYLAERECSIQRRHQKVIEEAPSPFLDEATRKAMGEQAVALAKAVGYKSAGTVEFIVDAQRNFYFLEMNTRLQVEHPVTELITGLDLVEWMIKIAAGQPLTLKQSDVTITGWAMEARIYAEDPYRNFMPSTGRLVRYTPPRESDTVRVDTGVYEGGAISMFYDPMIAKLITYGAERSLAIKHMRTALDQFHIRGVSHNIPFLASLFGKQRFADGLLTTNFIPEEYKNGFSAHDLPPEDPAVLVCVAATVHHQHVLRNSHISNQMKGVPRTVGSDYVVRIGDDDYHPVSISANAKSAGWSVLTDNRTYQVASSWTFGQPMWIGHVEGQPLVVQIDPLQKGLGYQLSHQGGGAEIRVYEPHTAELAKLMPIKPPPDTSKFLLSPMPGILISVDVTEGQEVKSGEKLAVVEAMKMENVLRAERDGIIKSIHAPTGASLKVDETIIEFA